MATNFSPNQYYRYSYKEGMRGADVWCIQIALNGSNKSGLEEDGVFGPRTKRAVMNQQEALKITRDGICGPETQRVICNREAARYEKGLTPGGLLRGLCEGESGAIIPATTGLYGNGSRDYGPYQDNKTDPSQSELKEAFNVGVQARRVAAEINTEFNKFQGRPGAPLDKDAWRLAVLYHNWPAASYQIAAGNGDVWKYSSEGKGYKLADKAPWIEAIGVEGVDTGWDWCEFYINSKTMYVDSWTVV